MDKKLHGIFLYRRLLAYAKPYWFAIVLAIIGNIFYGGVDAYAANLFNPLINKGFIGKDLHFLHIFPLIVISLFLVRGIGSFVAAYFLGQVARKIVLKFRQQIFQKFLVLPAKYYDDTTSGQMLAKLTYNVDQITQAGTDSLATIVREGFSVIAFLFVMFHNSWQLSLLTFLILPFVIIGVRFTSKRFRKLSKRIQTAMGDVMHLAEETIVGYREVKIYGGQKQQFKQFNKVALYNYLQELKVIVTDALNNPVIQFMGSLAIALVIYIAFHGQAEFISPGAFAALLTAMIGILKPIRNLTSVNNSIQKGLAAAESIFDLLDQPDEENNSTKTLAKVQGRVKFEQVSFQYKSDAPFVLNDINLEVIPGQTVAFVGRSGSGKSTLMSLLARFYTPSKGGIYLDGENIQDLELYYYRKQIALVSQHVTLFDNTVFHNIAYGQERVVSTEEVITAAKAAHAWDFIQALPQGLETHIGENGLNLSGGQRQRLAIARAILKNAPILILDEATSALDNESERAIQAALEELKKGRTTLVIAHRLSTIEKADNIVVMDHGVIREMGTQDTLLAAKGIYYQLHQTNQF